MNEPLISVEPKLVKAADPFGKIHYNWKVRLTFLDGSYVDVEDAEVIRQMRRTAIGWLEARTTGANVVPRDPATAVKSND